MNEFWGLRIRWLRQARSRSHLRSRKGKALLRGARGTVQTLGGAGSVTADGDDETRDFALSLRHSDREWQVVFHVPFSMLSRIPKETAARYCVIPVAKTEAALTLASRKALTKEDWELLRFVVNQEIRLIMATEESIRKAISLAYFITHD